MKIHHLRVADALASLKSGLAGLSDAEAQRRLVEFGTNEVEEVAHEALLLTFAKEFAHFLRSFCGSPRRSRSSPSGASRGKAWRHSGSRSST